MNAKYGHLELAAIRWTQTEGWQFSTASETWVPLHPAEAVENGSPLTKAEFEKMFPNLPDLPKDAFK